MIRLSKSLSHIRSLSCRPVKVSHRLLGSSHHHDEHSKPAGPYDAPHKHIDQDHAYFPGMAPDYKYEGWEYIGFGTMAIVISILVFGPSMVDHTDLKTWARREALAREAAREKGEEIEFGKYYQGIKYKEPEEIGGLPTVEE